MSASDRAGHGSARGRGGGRGGRGSRGGRGDYSPRVPSQTPSAQTRPLVTTDAAQETARVRAIENQLVTNISAKLADMNLSETKAEEDRLPMRPGYGTQLGKLNKTFPLRTNYYQMTADSGKVLYRYEVQFNVPETSKRRTKRLIECLLQTMPGAWGRHTATDFARVIISTRQLLTGNSQEFTVLYNEPDEEPFGQPVPGESPQRVAARARRTKRLNVIPSGTMTLSHLLQYLNSGSPHAFYGGKESAVQALNIVMNMFPHTRPGMAVMGGNKFFPTRGELYESVALGGGLIALRGYYSSVRTSVGRVLLNVNVAAAAFYKPCLLSVLIEEWKTAAEDKTDLAKLDAFLSGLRVETNYIRKKDDKGRDILVNGKPQTIKRIKTIHGLSRGPGGAVTGLTCTQQRFQWDQGNGKVENTTVADYFERVYSLPTGPYSVAVNVGSGTGAVWIPPEHCSVLSGQPAGQMLSGNQTTIMLRFAARRPQQNIDSIEKQGVQVLGLRQPSEFGTGVITQMLTVQARRHDAPEIKYRQSSEIVEQDKGRWNLTKGKNFHKFYTPKPLEHWAWLVIHLQSKRTTYNSQKILSDIGMLRHHGINVATSQKIYEVTVSAQTIAAIDPAFHKIFNQIINDQKRFLFVLLPNGNKRMHHRVRTFADVKYGILHQCLQAGRDATDDEKAKNFKARGVAGIMQTDNRQYLGNVALKVNMKLGGVNHCLDSKALTPADAKTIMFGLDVTHPSPDSSKGAPSVASIVASADECFSQWPGDVYTQGSGVEIAKKSSMVADLENKIVERLEHWRASNQAQLPDKAIVFRDGVSEGQYGLVLSEELPAFRKAFDRVYGNQPHPKIAIIVVGKRHHTRFYAAPNSTGDQNGNPKSGTVVDRDITGERTWDLFIQAHVPLQGTARPAHYIVLKDEIGFTADSLERMLHNLSYLFARATMPVSICPGAYYADVLCERGRAYLHADLYESNKRHQYDAARSGWTGGVHKNLKNSMFYI